MSSKHRYTNAEVAFLRENITGRHIDELASMFNAHFGSDVPLSSIHAALANRGLMSGVDCRFSKGHTPANKGEKGIRRSPATEFKKGQVPVNYRPVGSERVNVDGYIEIKVADPNKWRPKHVVLWEAANGPKPRNSALLFADGNPLNVNLDNLVLISRSQLCVLNHMGLLKKDKALNETALLTADLILKIAEVKRKGAKRRKELTQ